MRKRALMGGILIGVALAMGAGAEPTEAVPDSVGDTQNPGAETIVPGGQEQPQDTLRVGNSTSVSRCLPFIFGNLGYTSYSMADINRTIDNNNAAYKRYSSNLETKITNGALLGLGAGMWFFDYLAVGAEMEYHGPTTAGGTTLLGQQLNLSALDGGAFLKVRSAKQQDRFFFTGTFEVGYLSLYQASVDDYLLGSHLHAALRGGTLSYKISGGLEFVLAKHFGLGLDVGYRQAKITDVRADFDGGPSNVQQLNADRTPLSIDYSGVFAKLGVRFYF